jgi:cation diffusion facilitator CzcD-associated flavoprotein CzcO
MADLEVTAPGRTREPEVDVVIVGAGILGLYQLYRAREAGFSARLLEAGTGVGGTWYWNRYPGARFDSESYTYAYLFSHELFHEWDWQEHFAAQPDTEAYLNHVVDRFDLRRLITFGARVNSAVWDESAATWTVRAEDGTQVTGRHLISATGVLSIPIYPPVPGREDFEGEAYHTGLWPKTPVDFKDKRVAVIGVGSSGVQVVPEIADDTRPITPEEQAELKAGFEEMRRKLNDSISGFLHEPHDRKTFEDSKEERWAFYEKLWNSPGFTKLSTNYTDMLFDPAANGEWCEFFAEKIRSIVDDPETAEKLIPADAYGAKRPPFGTGYYEAYNNPKVELVSIKDTPIQRVTPTGIETADGHKEFDIIVWATGFDFGTGALNRMGIRGRGGFALEEYWANGPATFLGLMCHHFPNFFFPGGPHGAAGNNPRYGGDQCDWIADLIEHAREHGYTVIEVPAETEELWTDMVNVEAEKAFFTEASYFYGSNVPGKPRRYLLNPMGRPKLLELMQEAVASGYQGYLSRHDALGAGDEVGDADLTVSSVD